MLFLYAFSRVRRHSTMLLFRFSLFLLLISIACKERAAVSPAQPVITDSLAPARVVAERDSSIRTIHVFVALCDNRYQGIVPVPSGIGNGQHPASNLYWGAGYGVKTYFTRKSSDWQLVSTQAKPAPHILERLLLRHRSKNIYLLADAYDGQYIRETTIDFFSAAAGRNEVMMPAGDKEVYFGGAADLVAYVGHDGLMDFSLDQRFEKTNDKKREAIMLACYSKRFFAPHLQAAGAWPLLWTSGLMAPEAYTLYDAITEWTNEAAPQQIRLAAAQAYAKYQRCSLKAAQNLLVQDW